MNKPTTILSSITFLVLFQLLSQPLQAGHEGYIQYMGGGPGVKKSKLDDNTIPIQPMNLLNITDESFFGLLRPSSSSAVPKL